MKRDSRSIRTYEKKARVASYDRDMDIMHPNRHKMVDVLLENLPYAKNRALRVLDIGAGTGFLSERILKTFPKAVVTGVDGSGAMLEVCRARLGRNSRRARLLQGDFRDLGAVLRPGARFDAAVSAYALHHLTPAQKLRLLRSILKVLKPGGFFFNADILVSPHKSVERRYQELRILGVTARAGKKDRRYSSFLAAENTVKGVQRDDGDRPQTIEKDMALLKKAGFRCAEIYWKEYREAVLGGRS